MMTIPKFFVLKKVSNDKRDVKKQRRKCEVVLKSFKLYLVLCLCVVPIALSEKGLSPQLTFETIFNTTNYAQIHSSHPTRKNNYNYTSINPINKYYEPRSKVPELDTDDQEALRDNKLEVVEHDEMSYSKSKNKQRGKLLVGFSHDPYMLSVPEDEFSKGVRASSSSSMKDRGKRGVSHLYNMIQCATGCDPIIYKGYGCYCGFLGSGRYTDPIDRCCKMHDQCYENIYCPLYTVYFQPYYWTCFNREPLCAFENHWPSSKLVNGCAGRLCECDRLLAMCLRRYRCPRRRALCRSSPLRLLQNVLMIP